MAKQLPKYELLPEEKTKELLKLFDGELTGYVQVEPEKWFFPHKYIEQAAGFLLDFMPRKEDTYVVSYPRSGSAHCFICFFLLQ